MMLQENLEGFPPSSSSFQKGNQGVEEMLKRPDIIFMIFAAVFLVFASAIRLTRASLAATIESFQTYVESEHQFKKKGIFRWIKGKKGYLGSFLSFWDKIPRRVWNFYIEVFLVPGYRKEWGRYRVWSFQSRERPPKPPHIQKMLRDQKRRYREQQAIKTEGTDLHNLTPHNHAACQRIRINICGVRYETQLRTLERFPDTLLGNPRKRVQYFDPVKQEYYFDRNRHAFEAILHFYQSGGRFRRPDNIQADILLEDAQFFQLSEAVIDQYQIEEGLSPPSSRYEIVPLNLLRRKIWLLMDAPESSLQAAYIAVLSTAALFLSIIVFCLETMEQLELKQMYDVDLSSGRIKASQKHPLNLQDAFFFTEFVCNIWFVVEILIRFICCPFYWRFLKDPLNIIDIVAIFPFLISAASPSTSRLLRSKQTGLKATDSLYLLRVVRVVRVFRIFKLSRHSRGLQILGKTLKASLNELVLLMFFIVLGVILFSSTMYFAEIDDPNTQFSSIPHGFWWALITITTVGFGDVVPKTFLGKIVGSLCAVAGVLTIALPVPVIVSNFNFFYHQAIDEGDLRWMDINHVSECPYRPCGSNNGAQGAGKRSRSHRHKRSMKMENKEEEESINPKYSSDEDFSQLKNKKLNKQSQGLIATIAGSLVS